MLMSRLPMIAAATMILFASVVAIQWEVGAVFSVYGNTTDFLGSTYNQAQATFGLSDYLPSGFTWK